MTDRSAAETNGAGAAAVLAAGVGYLSLGVLALAGDALPAVAHLLDLWNPTGPLSGVTSGAILVWLLTWALVGRLWSRKTVNLARVNGAAIAMIVASLLLTFPPFMDFLQGK